MSTDQLELVETLARPWCVHLRGCLGLQRVDLAELNRAPMERWSVVVRLPIAQNQDGFSYKKCLQALKVLSIIAWIDDRTWRLLLRKECAVTDDRLLEFECLPPLFMLKHDDAEDEKEEEEKLDGFEQMWWLTSLRDNLMIEDNQKTELEYEETIRELMRLLESSFSGQTPSETSTRREIPILLDCTPALTIDYHNLLSEYMECVIDIVETVQAQRRSTSIVNFVLDSIRLDLQQAKLATKALAMMHQLVNMDGVRITWLGFYLAPHQTEQDDRALLRAFGDLINDVIGKSKSTPVEKQLPPIATSFALYGTLVDSDYFAAFCSSIAESDGIQDLYLDSVLDDDLVSVRHMKWKWLAHALFSRNPASVIERLFISESNFTMEDINAMASIYRSTSMSRELMHSKLDELSADNVQFVVVREHAMCQMVPVRLSQSDQEFSGFPLPQRGRYQLIANERTSTYVDIVVPGYGQCRVLKEDVVSVELATTPLTERVHGIKRLIISMFGDDIDRSGALPALLRLLGPGLQALDLYLSLHELVLEEILSFCPKLSKLTLTIVRMDSFNVFVDYSETKKTPLTLLDIQEISCSSDEVAAFATVLADPTRAFSKALTHLTLGESPDDFDDERTPMTAKSLLALLEMLKTNRTLVHLELYVSELLQLQFNDQFDKFHGAPLPVVREKFPVASRLAFLSVLRRCFDTKSPTNPYGLHWHLCLTIFQFAATCVTRTVKLQISS